MCICICIYIYVVTISFFWLFYIFEKCLLHNGGEIIRFSGFENFRVKLNSSEQPRTSLTIWWFPLMETVLRGPIKEQSSQSPPRDTHLKQFMLLKSLTGNIQGEIIWVHLHMAKESSVSNKHTGKNSTNHQPNRPFSQSSDTYNTLDKVKVLGHHIMEVVCDEHSAHIQLGRHKKKKKLPPGNCTFKLKIPFTLLKNPP